jgi:hypothetical protein
MNIFKRVQISKKTKFSTLKTLNVCFLESRTVKNTDP